MEVGLGPGHIVLDGDPAPLPQRGTVPIFGAYLLWPNGGWIKMPLGREVSLNPSDIVLDRNPALARLKGARPPVFGPCLGLLWLNG